LAEIIELVHARRQMAASRGFSRWSQRFGESFDANTSLQDLSDATLALLIQAGEQTTLAIHDLIMGIKNLGPGARFQFLDHTQKMAMMDIAIFLMDQFRFECMRRLGWIEGFNAMTVPLVDMVSDFAERFAPSKNETPSLSSSHPRYPEYQREYGMDRAAFLRRMIPDAIEAFLKHLQQSG
jgi:hypothetical protein